MPSPRQLPKLIKISEEDQEDPIVGSGNGMTSPSSMMPYGRRMTVATMGMVFALLGCLLTLYKDNQAMSTSNASLGRDVVRKDSRAASAQPSWPATPKKSRSFFPEQRKGRPTPLAQQGPKPPMVIYREQRFSNAPPSYPYCDRNATSAHCCNPQHCEKVLKSSMYSACCHNDIPPPDQQKQLVAKERAKRKPMDKVVSKIQVFPLLITATPRSGTVFTETMLSKLGLPMAHDWQAAKLHGQVSWMHFRKDETYFSPASLLGSKFFAVWHQVRDPLKSLTSMSFTEPLKEQNDYSLSYMKFLRRHIQMEAKATILKNLIQKEPKLRQGSVDPEKRTELFLIYRGLEFYIQWHRDILDLNVPRMQLEDFTSRQNMTVLDSIFESIGQTPPDHAKAVRVIQSSRRRRRLRQMLQQQQQQDHQQQPGKKRRKLATNARKHRPTLEWHELCHVSKELTKDFLTLSHELGYYQDMTSVCD